MKKNVKNLYNSQEKIIKWYHDYPKIRSEAKYKANKGGLK